MDTAIDEKVDMVIFAGDAYKDRSPAPTFQREWGRRIIRLSQAKIPTLLLVGNLIFHPPSGAHMPFKSSICFNYPMSVFETPELLHPKDLWDLPIQVIAMPWIALRFDGITRYGRDLFIGSLREHLIPHLGSSKAGSKKLIQTFH